MKKKQGISLIVLVITIIVMIILAAAVVITLSNTGIINRANVAVKTTNEKQIEQLVSLAWAEAYADGLRDNAEIKEYIEEKLEENKVDTSGFNVIVRDNGVELKRGYGVVLMQSLGDETYKGKPVVYATAKATHDSIEIIDNQIKVVNDVSADSNAWYFDIITDKFSFNVVDMTEYMGEDTPVYGVVMDSKNEIYSDLTKILYDDYMVILIKQESDLEVYKTADYYMMYSMWVGGYYNVTSMKMKDLVGTDGISSGIYKYSITKNGEVIYNSYFHDDNFGEAKRMAEDIMKMSNAVVVDGEGILEVTTPEYILKASKGLFYAGAPFGIISEGEFAYDKTNLAEYLYDMSNEDKYPLIAIHKETNEYLYRDDIKESLSELSEAEKEAWLKEYKYFVEEKYYSLVKGSAFKID